MITLHDLDHSRSSRLVWLMEELALPYEHVFHTREPTMQAPASLKQIHPLGKSPVIQDGELTLIESGAIVEYILNRHGQGRLRPAAEAPTYPAYLQWLHYAEGSAMPPVVFDLLIRATGGKDSLLGGVVKGMWQQHLQHMNDVLAGQPYFAGQEFTAADIMMEFPINAARGSLMPGMESESLLKDYPHLIAFLERVHARPAYQRCLAKINPA